MKLYLKHYTDMALQITAIKLTRSYLTKIFQFVERKGKCSENREMKYGVP